ncbi:GIY-YIG nuclease family protein [bacterium]|jgi:hypothetical protein|nr:GIY-YIG nuclease family protein [bacterium]
MNEGWIYILINPALKKDLLKIGKTKRHPEARAKELSTTGIPTEFHVAYELEVKNCDKVEAIIHKKLSSYRYTRNREFFKIPLRKAILIMNNIAEETETMNDLKLNVQNQSEISKTTINSGELEVIKNSNIQINEKKYSDRIKTIEKEPKIRNAFIAISEDSDVDRSIIPGPKKTVARIKYETLIENPYKFTERQLFYEVHVVRRKRNDLKIDSYQIKRSPLVQKFGWGIHVDNEGRLALIAKESSIYSELVANDDIKKIKAYKRKKA